MPTSTKRTIDGGWEVQLYNYEKWKLHVMKRSKNTILSSQGFADWFVGLKRYPKFEPKPF